MTKPRTRAEAKATITPNRWVPRPEFRAWLYNIAIAVIALLGGVGIITRPDLGDQILAVVSAVLAIGPIAVARANVPRE